jgi:DNA-binding NtrC family response regulator
VHRVGSLEPRKVNVHVIAATNRDLRAEVAAGRFRSDLFYRLNIVEVKLPALRDRREDIPYLTAAFVRETSERLQKALAGLTPGAERVLGLAAWDGNVRELRNVIERACIMADGDFITERELAVSMPALPYTPPRQAGAASAAAPGGDAQPADDLLVTVEREHIQRALVRAHGNKKAAARMLGLSRRALYRRLERLDLGDTIMRRRDPSLEAIGA